MASEPTRYTALEIAESISAPALTGTLTGNVIGNVTGNVTGSVTGNVTGYALKSEARTATADGTGTGTISAGVTSVVVTCDDADKIIILPAPVVGLEITLTGNATGYELRSSAPATIAINGGVGAAAESAVGANVDVVVKCMSATSWKAWTIAAAGTWAALEAAA